MQTQTVSQVSIDEIQAIRGARLASLIKRCRNARPWKWDGKVRNGNVTSADREQFSESMYHPGCQSLNLDVLDQAILQFRDTNSYPIEAVPLENVARGCNLQSSS